MNFLQTQEWGLMILDGKSSKDLVFVIKKYVCSIFMTHLLFFFI